mmetsp:Transcript_56306/g.89416  ORF Transcript_56306/g.89416 Transcript_56306/m.89416 type:complete len:420 (+) Transcript_56306:58-1317(+)
MEGQSQLSLPASCLCRQALGALRCLPQQDNTQLSLVLHNVNRIAHDDLVSSVKRTSEAFGFSCISATSIADLIDSGSLRWRAVVLFPDARSSELDICWKSLHEYRSRCPSVFTIVYDSSVCGDAKLRLLAFKSGARMVSDQLSHIELALARVATLGRGGGELCCPTCKLDGLTENELHLHHPLYHSVEPNDFPLCPICNHSTRKFGNFPMHLHNDHGPIEGREPPRAPYAAFAWVVCRHQDGRFLMVNEPAGISRGAPRYWLPAGRVDEGESLIDAARRETLEEGGIDVRITGVLRFSVEGLREPHPCPRIVFLAEPSNPDNAVPKSVPDWESVGAFWVSAESVECLARDDFRSPDPPKLFPLVASGQLRPHSIETDAFRQFDQLLVQLTAGRQRDNGDFARAWEALHRVYPAECFKEN